MLHELKCWPKYYAPLIAGLKTFELRRADRPFTIGDTLHVREWDPGVLDYTGRESFHQVTYALPVYITDEQTMYVILSVRPLSADQINALRPDTTPSKPTK